MVAYHDDEWGTPVADDVELFERLALESFQAGTLVVDDPAQARGVPGRVRRLRSRGGRAFDDADRARLMADAGIVRNRREDRRDDRQRRARSWRRPRSSARSTAYLALDRPGAAGACLPRRDVRLHPGDDAGLRRAVGGPPAARLPLRRLDDRLCVHAERRARRRPRPRLLPLPRLTRPTHRSRRSNHQAAAPARARSTRRTRRRRRVTAGRRRRTGWPRQGCGGRPAAMSTTSGGSSP